MNELDPISKILSSLNSSQTEIKRQISMVQRLSINNPEIDKILDDTQKCFDHLKSIATTSINYELAERRYKS